MSQIRSPRSLRSLRTAVASAAVAGGLLLALVPRASAAAPTVETWSNPRYGPYLDCPTFAVYGDWTVSHRLTTFFTNGGMPIRDIEVVTFSGRFVNPDNGAWVPDAGRTVYFDTLDADYNYLTTMANTQRTAPTSTAPAGVTSSSTRSAASTASPRSTSPRCARPGRRAEARGGDRHVAAAARPPGAAPPSRESRIRARGNRFAPAGRAWTRRIPPKNSVGSPSHGEVQRSGSRVDLPGRGSPDKPPIRPCRSTCRMPPAISNRRSVAGSRRSTARSAPRSASCARTRV